MSINYRELGERLRKEYEKAGFVYGDKEWEDEWNRIILQGIEDNLSIQERRQHTTDSMFEYLKKQLIP